MARLNHKWDDDHEDDWASDDYDVYEYDFHVRPRRKAVQSDYPSRWGKQAYTRKKHKSDNWNS